jgi:uncharacterized protein
MNKTDHIQYWKRTATRNNRPVADKITQFAAIELVKKFVKELQNKGIHLRKVYLFGSYARNEQRQFSDIDVALVADEFESIAFLDLKYFIDISIKKPYTMLELHTYNTDYFQAGNPFIDEEIKPKGIVIL